MELPKSCRAIRLQSLILSSVHGDGAQVDRRLTGTGRACVPPSNRQANSEVSLAYFTLCVLLARFLFRSRVFLHVQQRHSLPGVLNTAKQSQRSKSGIAA